MQKQVDRYADTYPNCKEITGNVVIGVPYGTTDIHDLTPLNRIKSIGGHLNILNNRALMAFSGLDSLQSIGGYLNIYNNDQLVNLNGLNSLSSVGGNLWILKNNALTTITALQNLRSIDGSLDISDNSSLVSLEGLQNINPGTITSTLDYLLVQNIDIRIEGNENLQDDINSEIMPNLVGIQPVKRFKGMAHKTYSQRAIETDLLYKYIETITDSVEAYRVFDQLENIAGESKNRDIQWEVELLKTNYQLIHGEDPFQERIARMEALADQFDREGMPILKARALKFISFIYINEFQDYEKLFKTYHALEQTIAPIPPESFPDMAQSYMIIGRTHFRFRDYQQAIHYFRKAAAIPQTSFNTTFVMHSRNNLGLCYQNLKLLDSSDYYFKDILHDTTSYPIEVWKGIASGNLGYNYYLRGAYQQAIPLLERDVQTATAMDDWGLAAGSLVPLADIRLKQNKNQQAGSLIQHAREYIRRSGQTDRLRLLFPVISKYHAALGNKALAADYVDSTKLAIAVYNEKFNALKLLRAQQELNANQLRLNKVERQQLYQQRNLISVIVLLLILFVSIFMWYRTKNFRRKQELRELALKNAKKSLENARSRLVDQARKIRENNKVIQQLQQEFTEQDNSAALRELKNSTILTSEDWILFKNNFQEAYPCFLNTLKTRFPALTQSEIRYLCLLKLRLTNREMAAAQGVSPQSIRVTTYRIRKKLDLDDQKVLEAMINEIE